MYDNKFWASTTACEEDVEEIVVPVYGVTVDESTGLQPTAPHIAVNNNADNRPFVVFFINISSYSVELKRFNSYLNII